MKKWAYHLFFKTLCVIFATLTLASAVLSAFGILLMVDKGGYRRTFDSLREEYLTDQFQWLIYNVAAEYDEYIYSSATASSFYSYLDSLRSEYDFYCRIASGDGKILYFSDYEGQNYRIRLEEVARVGGAWETIYPQDTGEETYATWNPREYQVTLFAGGKLTGNQETHLWLLETVYDYRIIFIPAFLVSLLLFLFLGVFLCCAAGRRGDREEVFYGFFDKIPLELFGIFAILLLLFEIWFLEGLPSATWLMMIFALAFLVADCAFVCLFAMTLSTRQKGGIFYRYTLTRHAVFLFRKMWKGFVWFLEKIKLVPKIFVLLSGLAIFDFFLASVLDFSEFLAALLIEGIFLSVFLIWYGASVQSLLEDLKELSRGKAEHRCDVTRLPPGLRSFGEEINRSAEGMGKAVEEKMKSERFKTELITNVSHDIKTPLTSIISYVDLMKKEEPENEKMKEYLEVLERQSARLKKLAEDLVESSKAASGILPVDLAPCDLKVLMEQALGEYQSVFEEKGLVPTFTFPEGPLFVMADGKRLWRVLDNLMNNISKYALSGTRVLGTLEERDEKVFMVLRNISALPLELTGEDLSERFIRGDASRNTEGSGLGLAIARSLVELQKGKMEIFVDGDLFKVVISFDPIP